MQDKRHHFAETFRTLQAACRGVLHGGRVTVLFFILASSRCLGVQRSAESNFRAFEFRCEFQMPIAPGRVDGFMACDGRRQRIAIYWAEPPVFREAPYFLRCCDLIIDRDVVDYWIQGMAQPRTFHLSGVEESPALPAQDTAGSILRSALAIVSQVRGPRAEADPALELAKFLGSSRGRTEYKYEARPGELRALGPSSSNISVSQVLNAMPFGREYSKQVQADGSVTWRVQKASSGARVATVTIRRLRELGQDTSRGAFDEQTLGQWALIPEAYRAYWSFDRALAEAYVSSESHIPARSLYGELSSYLDQNKVPFEVAQALGRLRFQAALRAGDSNCVWRAAQALVTRLCADETSPRYQCLVDLGSMSAQIKKQYPDGMEERLGPLVRETLKHVGHDLTGSLRKLMATIEANGWFTFGKLLLEEGRREGLLETRTVEPLTARLEALRSARETTPADPCDLTGSVKRYLAQLDCDPPKGAIDLDGIRRILDEALGKQYPEAQSEAKRRIVDRTLRLLRLVAGPGPFRGDPPELVRSVERFSHVYLAVGRAAEPVDTVLATFLALSFCDTSTPKDHEILFSQADKCCADLQLQINTMLNNRGLSALVTPQDVNCVVQSYERIFRQYVDDPLWPTSKFPWTVDEQTRLGAKLRLSVMALAPFLEEMALKVKYGGTDPQLKKRTLFEISRTAQQLVVQAAFLRGPPFPGVSFRYYDGYGFTAVIEPSLYREGNRSKERFRAMKYFHLGHRLEEVVLRERELITPSERQEMSHEATRSGENDPPR